MDDGINFQSVVFAGGGSRCFWEAGFWQEAAPALNLKPKVVAGVSAGATISCLAVAGKLEHSLDHFKKITGANKKNFYFSKMFTKENAFPHYNMYRGAILESIDDKALNDILNGPQILILLAKPPVWLGPRSATFVGMFTYSVEKKIKYPVHPSWASGLGFNADVVSVKECRTREELADLLLQSSCTPPMVPIQRRNGNAILDGGLIDNVPVAALKGYSGDSLVMLSRQYPEDKIPETPGRIYVQPSEPIPITKWDYTNPQGLQAAYDLGRRDGENFSRDMKGRVV